MEYHGNWKEIWEQKGTMVGTEKDILVYDGWEKSNTPIEEVAAKIVSTLDICPTDRVLEVGCGAGAMSKFIKCDYVGCDFSHSLIKRNIEFYGNQCIWSEAADLPFKDGVFDKVFCFGVFLYFENKEYAFRVINEMQRVTKSGGGVFIGDVPMKSHSEKHLLYSKADFDHWKGFELLDGWCAPYERDRFNALITNLKKENI